MAKVSLRIYNQEVENLVERGQLDEAIANCRHILNAFPKNLETYRVIGKAYLEAKRFNEATDIFERLLMAVPDDFVAHVGMSIIHDEQNNLDASIWHMQRAFEVQPSNAAIQAELQRLYGRRDGVEPPKIRLTRGALAHMYVQGELYPQAISEINNVLEEDPERQDMQVLLARAYFHAGQRSEAAEMCSQLLRRYPYCFDANRVLLELIPQTEQGENTQIYRARINELDPYAAYTTGSVFHTDEVADAAVSLERLDWNGQSVDMEPEWGVSLGIGRDEGAATDDEEPDWLKTGLMPESPAASILEEEPASTPGMLPTPTADDGEDEIPEFLREAGWGTDTGAFQEGSSTFDDSDESSEEPAIAEGDLPDWVKAMAPTGTEVESAPPHTGQADENLAQDDVPDWLQGIGDAQSETPAGQAPTTGEDVPDWLRSMKSVEEPVSEPQESVAEASVDDKDEDLPDWLQASQGEDEQAAPQDAFPESTQEPVLETPAVESESLSDWQIGDEVSDFPVDADKTDTGSLGTSTEEQDDAIAWLEGLASKHGAKPEELVTDPEARKETEPDWVQQAKMTKGQESAEMPVAEELPPAAVEEPDQPIQEMTAATDLPDFLAEEEGEPAGEPSVRFDKVDTGELGMSAEEQDDAVAWLEGLASKHGAKPEELVTDPEARKETEPDWVQRAKMAKEQEGAEVPVAEEQYPATAQPEQEAEAAAGLPDFLDEEESEPVGEPDVKFDTVDTGGLGTTPEEQDDAVAWLEGLASKHGAKPEELVTDPEARKETAPDWVQKAAEAGAEAPDADEIAPPEQPAVEEPVSSTDADDIGAWLGTLDEQAVQPVVEETAPEQPAAVEDDKTGMWLDSLDDEAGQPAVEGDVTDWLSKLEAEESELGDAPEAEAAQEPASEAEPEPPEWLREMEADASSSVGAEEPVKEAAADDLPAWLSGMDSETEEQQSVTTDADLPEWLRAEDEPEPAEPEPTAPTDWRPAEITEPELDEQEEISVPAPIQASKVKEQPVPEPPPPAPIEAKPEPEPGREAYREPVTRSRSGMTGMLSTAQDPLLVEAQNELTRGNIPGAMESYGKLIKKGKMLDEVIFDLREALYRYPVEVIILQTLGDAYMRASRLQDALDSYTKAEELLR